MSLLTLPSLPTRTESVKATAQVFEDPLSRALLKHLQLIAPSEASVLITGATGTGKELVARHIHNLSARRRKPFIAINCGAFSSSLIEAELFGHEKGAFTGALFASAGWFEEANGGTLFLDEIGDLPLPMQVKLLRVLQEKEVIRLGSRKPIPINVRVLAATNMHLEKAIAAGHFREDLYYRLNVVNLQLLPLRERPGDILPLARHFINKYRINENSNGHNRRLGYRDVELSEDACQRLIHYNWPGNIRQLENVIHHTLLICHERIIRAENLHLANTHVARDNIRKVDEGAETLLEQALSKLFETQDEAIHEKVEDTLLRMAYHFCNHNQVHTAKLLGLSRNITRAHLIRIGELVVKRR